MPLHKHESIRDELLDSVYAGKDLSPRCLRNASPKSEMRGEDAYQAISDELLLDGNARQNLATFCQTWEEDEVHQLMDLSIEQEHDRQGRVPPDRRDRAALRPDAGRPVERSRRGRRRRLLGHRFVGGLHARGHGRQVAVAGQAEGRRASRPTTPTWCAARSRWCGTSSPSTGTSRSARSRCPPGKYCMDVEQMLAQVDENTIMVVPTFGVTYTGAYEPVLELAKALDKLAEEHRSRHRHPRGRGRRGPSSPRSAPPTSCGTSASPGSSRSAPPATSSASPPSAWVGCCGATPPTCPTT